MFIVIMDVISVLPLDKVPMPIIFCALTFLPYSGQQSYSCIEIIKEGIEHILTLPLQQLLEILTVLSSVIHNEYEGEK